MAIRQEGPSGNVQEVGPVAASPAHVVAKPHPYGNLGHYRVARRFLPVASAAAAANFVAFRNPGSNPIVLTRLRLRLLQIAAPTAAIEHRIGAFVARAYTAADGTGVGATVNFGGNNTKKRTSMAAPTAVLTETNVAAGLTGGTKTLDADAFALAALWVLAAVPTTGPPPEHVYEWEPAVSDGIHPVTLAQNEGILLQNIAVLGAATGVALYYEIGWAELPAF
jgi:hypothetical protein